MKLKNKISGEIKEFSLFDGKKLQGGATLKSLTEEWEDYEEPKDGWCIDYYDAVKVNPKYDALIKEAKLIGNYFETKEEAEKALEKLKAWKRLKDKKIFIWLDHFDYRSQDGSFNVEFGDNLSSDELNQVNDDLDLIFFREDD